MASTQELQARLDAAEAELRRRDREAAEAKAAAHIAANKTDDAEQMAARLAAESEHRERIRKGAWASHLIAAADPAASVNFALLDSKIPAVGWPEGLNESKFVIAAPLPKEKSFDVGTSTMGKLLNSKGRV